MSQTLHHGKAHAPSLRRLFTPALFAALAFTAVAATARVASAQPAAGSPDLVISQVYTRGGEPGSTYQNDFIEVFNRGNVPVDLTAYNIVVFAEEEPSDGSPGGRLTSLGLLARPGTNLDPGKYYLYQFGSSSDNGAPLPMPDEGRGTFLSPSPLALYDLPSKAGRIAIVKGVLTHNYTRYGCSVGVDAALADFFSYGAATCVEGDVNFPAPSPTTAALRDTDGCGDTDNNVADFLTATPNPRNSSTPRRPCTFPAAAGSVQFESATATVSEGAGFAEIFVTRSGATGATSIQYATTTAFQVNIGFGASEFTDYTTTLGTLDFAAGETRKSFRVLVTDDARLERDEPLTLSLNYPTAGVVLDARHVMRLTITDNDAAAGANPIDATDFFVRQHYADFLSRVPDESGRTFWTGEVEKCGADPGCREIRRIHVSAAFFLSIEFRDTGFYAYRAYKAALPDSSSRPRGFPLYRELWRDAQVIGRGVVVHQDGWEQRLAANKQAYTLEFVMRPEFLIRYPQSLSPGQFVDNLNATAGGVLSQAERDRQVANLTAANNGAAGRAAVLASVVEDEDFSKAEFNRAFVLMQYFGYLRRNPFDAPDTDFTGYDFWRGKLDAFNGNFIRAEMVKAFLSSDEYRARFLQAPAP